VAPSRKRGFVDGAGIARGSSLSPLAAVARVADNVPTRDIVALGTDHALWHFELFDP
jgi:hypothetical protein